MLSSVITHLHHCIPLNVILEAFELQMKDRVEGLENNTLLRILQTIAFCHVFVVAIQSLYSNIVLERLIQVLHALDIKLDIYSASR